MPINNDLPDRKHPMTIHYNEEQRTQFLDAIANISITLMDAPTRYQTECYAPSMGLATWEDKPRYYYTTEETRAFIKKMFEGEVLPTVMETINFTFLISNIDYIDVTHLIRHRTMSFSAHCTADRDMRHDDALVKPSIIVSKFLLRYMKLVNDCKQLYADMVDSQEVSIIDARTVLPRCLENHYYARVNLKDLIHFLKQRLDRQIQPESDNIIALKMYVEVCKIFPEFKKVIDLDAPDKWYIKTAPGEHSSNLYMPEKPRNDVFDYKEQWFIYKKQRHQMPGGDTFVEIWNGLVEELNKIGE